MPPASKVRTGAAKSDMPFHPWLFLSFSASATDPPEMRPAFSSVSGMHRLPLKILCIVVIPTIINKSQLKNDKKQQTRPLNWTPPYAAISQHDHFPFPPYHPIKP